MFVFNVITSTFLEEVVRMTERSRTNDGGNTDDLVKKGVFFDCFRLILCVLKHLLARCHDSLHLVLEFQAPIHELVNPKA
jgi:hypothetical protein